MNRVKDSRRPRRDSNLENSVSFKNYRSWTLKIVERNYVKKKTIKVWKEDKIDIFGRT